MKRKHLKCPTCGCRLPPHKGHTKTFGRLSDTQKQKAIQAMTINLMRAINNYSKNDITKYAKAILKTIRILV